MNDEQPRPFANSDEHNYTLTVEETADRYERADIPRTHRAIQKYCAVGKLDCRKTETEFGEKYLVAPYQSTDTSHTLNRFSPQMITRTDATVPTPISLDEQPRTETANANEQPRPFANIPPADDRYVTALERENGFLRDQILVKDTQIKSLTDHSQQTNVLLQSFQRLLAPLLASGESKEEPNSHQPHVVN
jgi:hypothetical protein